MIGSLEAEAGLPQLTGGTTSLVIRALGGRQNGERLHGRGLKTEGFERDYTSVALQVADE